MAHRSTYGYRTRPRPLANEGVRRLLAADAISQVQVAHETCGYRRV